MVFRFIVSCCLLYTLSMAISSQELREHNFFIAAQEWNEEAIWTAIRQGISIDIRQGAAIRAAAAREHWLYVMYWREAYKASVSYLAPEQQYQLHQYYLKQFGPYHTAFLHAIRENDIHAVQQWLYYTVDVNLNNGQPLIIAAARGNVWIVDLLLRRGADVTAQKHLPLRLATYHGQWHMVWYLIHWYALHGILSVQSSLSVILRYAEGLAELDWQGFLAVHDQRPEWVALASNEALFEAAQQYTLPTLTHLIRERLIPTLLTEIQLECAMNKNARIKQELARALQAHVKNLMPHMSSSDIYAWKK